MSSGFLLLLASFLSLLVSIMSFLHFETPCSLSHRLTLLDVNFVYFLDFMILLIQNKFQISPSCRVDHLDLLTPYYKQDLEHEPKDNTYLSSVLK